MTEYTQAESSPSENYLSYVFEAMRKNESFLRENAEDVYGEIIGLANDAIAYLGIILEQPNGEEEYVRRSMFYFLNHVLMPLSGAIWLDVIAGNLPVSFAEIRLILESLVKCFIADLRYPNESFFQERLRLLEDEKFEVGGKKEAISISKRMNEIEARLGVKKDFVTLWGKLSGEWVHTKGLMNQFVDQLRTKPDVPSWALVIPKSFTETDLETLTELGKRLAKLRYLLKLTVEDYRQQLNSQTGTSTV